MNLGNISLTLQKVRIPEWALFQNSTSEASSADDHYCESLRITSLQGASDHGHVGEGRLFIMLYVCTPRLVGRHSLAHLRFDVNLVRGGGQQVLLQNYVEGVKLLVWTSRWGLGRTPTADGRNDAVAAKEEDQSVDALYAQPPSSVVVTVRTGRRFLQDFAKGDHHLVATSTIHLLSTRTIVRSTGYMRTILS